MNYRVTSADGHVVSGSWSFELTVAGTGTPGPSATADAKTDPAAKVNKYVVVEYPSVVDGSELREANAVSRTGSEGDYQISFSFKPAGAQKFGEWTGKNINNYMAVVLNGEVKSAAFIKSQIFDSKHQVVVGNPEGKITLVEFFDYNCGYCKKALSDLSKLAKENPDLRIVLRDFPVLGTGSVEAAQVAMAVGKQLQGEKFWTFHQKLLGARGQAGKDQAMSVARDAGVDMGKLDKDLKSPDIRAGYEEVMHVADKLALTGTPSWVVGKEVIVGAVGYAELNGKIANFRKCGKTNCG